MPQTCGQKRSGDVRAFKNEPQKAGPAVSEKKYNELVNRFLSDEFKDIKEPLKQKHEERLVSNRIESE